MRHLVFLFLMAFLGCSSYTSNVAPENTEPTKKKIASAEPLKGIHKTRQGSQELVVALCSKQALEQARQVWENEGMALVKQSSATILALSWSDARSSQAVMNALSMHKTLFCAVEANQIYSIN